MLNRDFKEFAELLNAKGVEYLGVGGYALAAHWLDGVEFEACFARRKQVELAGVRLNIIGLEDFKTNKRAAGRLKDLADVESLTPPAADDSNAAKPQPSE